LLVLFSDLFRDEEDLGFLSEERRSLSRRFLAFAFFAAAAAAHSRALSESDPSEFEPEL
jgi:hypothetical protein